MTLAERGLRVSDAQRLEGGRSNLVFRLGDAVLKVYDPLCSNPLFANDASREHVMLDNLSGTGLAPQPCDSGMIGRHAWVLYEHIPGAPWRQGVEGVAVLLAKLHNHPKMVDLPSGPNGSEALTFQTRNILNIRSDPFGFLALQPEGLVPPSQQVSLIHGDPVPGNILVSPKGLKLIDWQCPALGDPTEDLAIFLSPAMQFLYRGAVLTAQEETTFLSAYPKRDVVLRYQDMQPWFHWRMAAYCGWRAQQGDERDRHAMNLELERLKILSA